MSEKFVEEVVSCMTSNSLSPIDKRFKVTYSDIIREFTEVSRKIYVKAAN